MKRLRPSWDKKKGLNDLALKVYGENYDGDDDDVEEEGQWNDVRGVMFEENM
jgi:hypothetical protein